MMAQVTESLPPNMNEVSSFWLQLSPLLVVVGMWGVNQQNKTPSLCLLDE